MLSDKIVTFIASQFTSALFLHETLQSMTQSCNNCSSTQSLNSYQTLHILLQEIFDEYGRLKLPELLLNFQ